MSLRQRERHFSREEKVKGQFLTPQEVADFIVDFLCLKARRKRIGIDPACGDGVFLHSLSRAGLKEVIGVDSDEGILKSLQASDAKVFLDNSLKPSLGGFEGIADIVVGNPPFSSKYGRIAQREILDEFELGRGRRSQAVEILFLEKFIRLAKPGGFIGVILPVGIFTALPLRYVREFILNNLNLLGIISLPRGIFRGRTTSRTCILLAQKGRHKGKCFMGSVERLEELPLLLKLYLNKGESESPLAFWAKPSPDFLFPLKDSRSRPWPTLRELIIEMHCGGTEYGERRVFSAEGIPFISAKVVTWLGIDFSKDRRFVQPGGVMDKERARTKVGDVLFVRVGVGCSGRAAVVTDPSESGVADDWIYIIRVRDISPFYLALFLATEEGKSQVNRLKRGVGTDTIPQSLLKTIRIPIPPSWLSKEMERGYLEMVQIRKDGRIKEAEDKFQSLVRRIEEWLSSGSS